MERLKMAPGMESNPNPSLNPNLKSHLNLNLNLKPELGSKPELNPQSKPELSSNPIAHPIPYCSLQSLRPSSKPAASSGEAPRWLATRDRNSDRSSRPAHLHGDAQL